ncbi:MAG: flavin monoamine oxidase family protein [Granulosicoccus sp.]
MNKPVLIIGGGLSGLVTARELTKRGIDFQLIEARDRFGGRILSAKSMSVGTEQGYAVDLGPAWFWSGQQHLLNLIDELNLANSVFLQPSAGQSVVEYQSGKIEKAVGVASMAGAYRLDGGIDTLIQELVAKITSKNLLINAIASQLTLSTDGVSTRVLIDGEHKTIHSQHVVLALPPRLVDQSLEFDPSLTSNEKKQLKSIPTWMAGHAKFVAIYKQPFWREEGLSGDGFSQRGPLAEIHDASPQQGEFYALFGFLGISATDREGYSDEVKKAAVDQLIRMFGDKAKNSVAVYYQDWALEPFTSTIADKIPQTSLAPATELSASEWGKRIIWSGSETANQHSHSNGYLEGAVESGQRASRLVIDLLADH